MDDPKNPGRREQKREETRQRIAQAGLRLFVEHGYEATTLDAIAEAAGIARRTFFYYFKSKEEVLQIWQSSGFVDALGPAMLEESTEQRPIEAVRHCLTKLCSRYENKLAVQVDALMQSTEALRARKQAVYVEMEESIFASLCQLWPAPERRASLRLVAMVTVSLLRSSKEEWRKDGGEQSISGYLERAFEALDRELRS